MPHNLDWGIDEDKETKKPYFYVRVDLDPETVKACPLTNKGEGPNVSLATTSGAMPLYKLGADGKGLPEGTTMGFNIYCGQEARDKWLEDKNKNKKS